MNITRENLGELDLCIKVDITENDYAEKVAKQLKEYQHRGIGKSLLKFVIENETFDKIMLEVRETNTNAIKLYEKFNFKEIYRRKKYYGDCDAVIMERMK